MFEQLDKTKKYIMPFPYCIKEYERIFCDEKDGSWFWSDIFLTEYIYWSFWEEKWKTDWVMIDPTDLTTGDNWVLLSLAETTD